MQQTSDLRGRKPKPVRGRLSSLSIHVKLAAVIAFGFILAFAASFWLEAAEMRKIGEIADREKAYLVSDLLAAQLQAPVQFKDSNRVRAVYGAVTEADPAVRHVTVRRADGEVLSEFQRASDAPGSAPEMGSAEIGDVALETGEAGHLSEGPILTVARPIRHATSGEVLGVLVMTWDRSAAQAAIVSETLKAILASVVVALIVLLAIVAVIARWVSRPIRDLGQAMQSIAARDYEAQVPHRARQDEIGQISAIVADFRDRLAKEDAERSQRDAETLRRQELFGELAGALSQLAEGQVDCSIDTARFSDLDEEYLAVCRHFNDVLAHLRTMLGTIMSTADSVRSSAVEISDVVADQSRRSESQAATLEESAAAIEELNTSVQNTANHAAEANQRIAQNRKQAEAGGEVVGRTVDAMTNIEKSSQQITAIIGVIDDIAFQTNLLALNAGVEAARAGEAGRGFAVVASEVRALAQRASESANEIKDLILRSSEQVTEGSALANKAGESLTDIIEGVSQVSDLVSQIASGSREQAGNLAEIKESVNNLDRVTQQNAAVIEESAAASRSLSEEATRMTEALRFFRLDGAVTEPLPAPARPAPDHDSTESWGGEAGTGDEAPVLTFASHTAASKRAVNDPGDWHEF